VDHRGQRVQPTAELESFLRLNIPLAAARATDGRARSESEPAPPGSGTEEAKKARRLAAIIKEQEGTNRTEPAADAIDVPFDVLETLLAPGVELKPYQRAGIAWMWRQLLSGRHGALLADDMGLGKTLQAACVLALYDALRRNGTDLRPHLIVCPVILLANWQAELRKFFRPGVFESTLVLHDDELRRLMGPSRTLDIARVKQHRLVITNYKTLERLQLALLRIDWGIVVLDEAQAIKNPDTATALAARGLKRAFGVCCTGTPVENRLLDLWALYDFMSPGDPFTSRPEFSLAYEDAADGVARIREALGYPTNPQAPLLRRTKTELALPPKKIELLKIPMLPTQVETERLITQRAGRQILQVLQDLQKLYQHPRLLEQGGELNVETAVNESPKLAACLDILRSIRERGEKVLIFTLWTRMQELLAAVIKKVLALPWVPIVNGTTNQGRLSAKYLDAFHAAPGFGVMILSPLAAGAGLNIVCANHVIHYGRWWNAAKEDQATDRVYRIGQTRHVTVYYPVLHHPDDERRGFDTKLHELVDRKRGMTRDFLSPRDEEDPTAQDLQQDRAGEA
jgi:SNF2 family DNA or RNA helicase